MRKIDWYIKQGQLSKDNSYKNLANKFLQKARQNLFVSTTKSLALPTTFPLRPKLYPENLIILFLL